VTAPPAARGRPTGQRRLALFRPLFLRILYAPARQSRSPLYAPSSDNFPKALNAIIPGNRSMSILDTLSLLLALGLAVYLLVALLRATRS